MIQPDMPQMTIWPMHFAYWMIKTTYTHSEYAHCFSTTTMVTRTRLNVTFVLRYLSCYSILHVMYT